MGQTAIVELLFFSPTDKYLLCRCHNSIISDALTECMESNTIGPSLPHWNMTPTTSADQSTFAWQPEQALDCFGWLTSDFEILSSQMVTELNVLPSITINNQRD